VDTSSVKKILESIKKGNISVEEGVQQLKSLYYADLGYAKIDTDRESRVGYPEVIYCAGKSTSQVVGIVQFMLTKNSNILATRASEEIFLALKKIASDAEYNALARTVVVKRKKIPLTDSYIAIVTAGTSDVPVAEEAAVTAELLGNRVQRIVDVGVVGIHRLFDKLESIQGAKVIIVIAGMEGALASVIGGLVDKPVIAVPTSTGYGAAFGGLAALLSMLNSCASGVGVVNIDNGFGAAYLASLINKLQ
jgi:NCAIR mutase (PurE)-related protein